MGKQNYRESIEKDRQEISVASPAAPARRVERISAKKQPKKKKNILLPTLFFLFILIPVTILIYVAFLYEPDDTITTQAVKDEVSIETNTPPETPLVPVEAEEEKESNEEKATEDKEAKEEEKEASAEAKKAAEEKAKTEEIAQKAAAEKAAAEKAAAEQKEQAEQKAEEQPEPQQAQKSYVVKPEETLYRIAVNNYGAAGAAAAVEKIKQANGLASNSISVGQTLILP